MKTGIYAFCTAAIVANSVFAADTEVKQGAQVAAPALVASNVLLGANVENGQNETIGSVDSIVLNRNGEAQYYLVGVGGVAGLGQSTVAVPADAVKLRHHRDGDSHEVALLLPLTQEKLEKAPAIEDEHYKELSDANWVRSNAQYFGASANVQPLHKDQAICVKSVTDAPVRATDDDSFGHLDAVIFDTAHNKAKYGIIGDGGTAGINEKYFAVAFDRLRITQDADHDWLVSVNANKAELLAAPQVTPDNYPELHQQATRDRIKSAPVKE